VSQSITMWRLRFGTITPVQCTKVATCYVWPVWGHGGREARVSCSASYHETWEQAHDAMLAKAERELQSARLMLARAQGEYGRIKGMKPPVDAEVQS